MNKIKEELFKLKDGRDCLIREIKISDAKETLEYLKKVMGESEYLLRYPEEVTFTLEEEKNILQGLIDNDRSIMLVAEVDGKLVANATISSRSLYKVKHRMQIGISVLKDYWRLGIGKKLFIKMEEFAKDIKATQMELEFIEGNDKAKSLYEKRGFKIVGETPNAVILKNGRILSEFKMVKILK